MFEFFLTLFGLGQRQLHKTEDRFTVASKLIAEIETTTMETGVRLTYEIDRIEQLANDKGFPIETAIEPLVNMQIQTEQLRELALTNRRLLEQHGANTKVISELESWSASCKTIPLHTDLTVRQIESIIQHF